MPFSWCVNRFLFLTCHVMRQKGGWKWVPTHFRQIRPVSTSLCWLADIQTDANLGCYAIKLCNFYWILKASDFGWLWKYFGGPFIPQFCQVASICKCLNLRNLLESHSFFFRTHTLWWSAYIYSLQPQHILMGTDVLFLWTMFSYVCQFALLVGSGLIKRNKGPRKGKQVKKMREESRREKRSNGQRRKEGKKRKGNAKR